MSAAAPSTPAQSSEARRTRAAVKRRRLTQAAQVPRLTRDSGYAVATALSHATYISSKVNDPVSILLQCVPSYYFANVSHDLELPTSPTSSGNCTDDEASATEEQSPLFVLSTVKALSMLRANGTNQTVSKERHRGISSSVCACSSIG